jgi:hypothetical protein
MIHFLPKTILHLIGKVLESTVIFSNEDKEIVDNGSEAMENGAEDSGPSVDPTSLLYCERFAEFLIDLLSQLPTRRYPADFLPHDFLTIIRNVPMLHYVFGQKDVIYLLLIFVALEPNTPTFVLDQFCHAVVKYC